MRMELDMNSFRPSLSFSCHAVQLYYYTYWPAELELLYLLTPISPAFHFIYFTHAQMLNVVASVVHYTVDRRPVSQEILSPSLFFPGDGIFCPWDKFS